MVKNHAIARKKSNDPAQEELRSLKDNWNNKVKLLIDNLINYKKLTNGFPNKFHMEKSNIKDPIPANPSDIIAALARDFSVIVSDSNKIINNQIQYSNSRRKSQKKASDFSNLESFGSNPATRFWSRLKNISITDSPESIKKKYRMDFLTANLNIYRSLNSLQNYILKSGADSIYESDKLLSKIEKDFYFFKKGLIYIQDNDKSIVDNFKDEIKIEENDSESTTQKALKIIEVYKKIKIENKDKEYSDEDLELLKSFEDVAVSLQTYLFKKNLNDNDKKEIENESKQIIKLWEDIKKENIFPNLQTVANNFLSKWLKKTKHKLTTSDKTSSFRLECNKICELLKNNIDQIMDSLEVELNFNYLNEKVVESEEYINKIRNIINLLTPMVKGNDNSKSLLQLMQEKKLTDFDITLSDEDRKKLLQNIRMRRLKEISQMGS